MKRKRKDNAKNALALGVNVGNARWVRHEWHVRPVDLSDQSALGH
jgi:hypothetical protein